VNSIEGWIFDEALCVWWNESDLSLLHWLGYVTDAVRLPGSKPVRAMWIPESEVIRSTRPRRPTSRRGAHFHLPDRFGAVACCAIRVPVCGDLETQLVKGGGA
jgi:hypothetical protein